MKKIFTLILTVFYLTIVSQAQVKGDMTQINLSPDFYELHLPFLCMNFASTNSNFNADFGGSFKRKFVYVDADFRISYVNGLEKYIFNTPEPKSNSIYAYESPKAFLVHTGFILSKKDVNTDVYFPLKSSGNTHYYGVAKGQKSLFVMLNLGYKKGFDWLTCEGKDLKFEGDAPAGFYTPAPEEVRTMWDYETVEIGVALGSMGYWEADIEGYGHRKSSRFTRLYLNMLLLTSSEIDPIYYGQTVYNQDQVYILYHLNDSPRTNVGVAIGAITNIISKFGIGGSAEFGYYPGIKGDFSSHLGFSFKSTLSFGNIIK